MNGNRFYEDIKMELTNSEKAAIDAFVSLAIYNGYEEDIDDIICALKAEIKLSEEDKYHAISRPDWKKKCGRDKIEEFGGLFWSWLVLMYGGYGTSPRFGWLCPEKAKLILGALQELRRKED